MGSSYFSFAGEFLPWVVVVTSNIDIDLFFGSQDKWKSLVPEKRVQIAQQPPKVPSK